MQASVGKGHSIKHRALDLAASVMQPKYPIEAISTFLNGFHFYADDMGRQIEAHHFCIHLRHDLHQCSIFDSNQPGARLIGIEYIVSEERFRQLPDDEKRLWHSHITRSNPASWSRLAFLNWPSADISRISFRPTARRFTH